MIAYLSLENDMMRFRTEDNSIDVHFFNINNATKIYKVIGFSDGIIRVKVKTNNPFNMENCILCSDTSNIEYDIHDILDLLGIPVKALNKVTKVKVEKSYSKKDDYYFRSFIRNGRSYIEVIDKTKKYRSVHNANSLNLIATNMSLDMVNDYSLTLKLQNSFLKGNCFVETKFDDDFCE